MIHFITMDDESLTNVLADCKDYAETSSLDLTEKNGYLKEIEDNSDWNIIYTGIFHDAIGDIKSVKLGGVFVDTEY